ncbi:MAG: DUF2333 family protein [Xanthomonadales bacterium]|nr:DUF2333 family protein [Gammaproteobacteria bacterium]MBT8053018.1 DUF2333 family protein [Gammaproteobacteria bacterium]NND57910.1 DUF2333 family protein [Xanthomonadales bacterium]NNK50790.1 DUF2333 family protein [Xanthomonadales bacterium]
MIKQLSLRRRSLSIGIPSALVLICLVMMFFLNHEPPPFNPIASATMHAQEHHHRVVTGYTTTATMIETVNVMLSKRGGYLSNDILPPWVFLDNVPNWEFGVLTQVRDLARAMRNDFSRSQTQSTEDLDLAVADPLFHYDSERWFPPDTEGRYRKANEALEKYLTRLSSPSNPEAQFYARADNLVDWLAIVEKRLGSLSQRLSASVGRTRLNTDLSGDPEARQSTAAPNILMVKTPWTKIDDNFYEARGTAWALVHFLHAMEVDFEDVLRKKNATVSFRQIIRELESTQEPLRSPMVLNGNQFGLFANHSLVMANYIARANAAIIDLRKLLQEG